MWLQVRSWWYAKGYGDSEKMPRDVREYIIRRYMKPAMDRLKTQEEKDQCKRQRKPSVRPMDLVMK
jgi:hypothetical protein